MKRFLAAVAAFVGIGALALVGPAVAVDEHAPHGPNGHPHHIHTENGECRDMQAPNMESGSRGLHHATNESDNHNGMWHGTCQFHNNHD